MSIDTAAVHDYPTLIAGEWRGAADGEWIESFNPFTGKPWARIPRCREADVEDAFEAAHRAHEDGRWRLLPGQDRARALHRLADLIAAEQERLAEVETTDNGKLISEMRTQMRNLPGWFRFYAGLADKLEGRVVPLDRPGLLNFTRLEPLGVVVAITPWNSPLQLAAWKLAPALAAGNTVVWKPSEHASVSALVFARLFEQAGFPTGTVNVVTGFGAEVGDALVTDPRVAKVAFTGGDLTGQSVYEKAASGIKPVTLELGGKSANVVFDDANLDEAVKGVVSGIFAATGQTCIAGSRAHVQRQVHDELVERLLDYARQAQMGNPLEAATQVGPMTTMPQYRKVLDYIDIAVGEGANCVLGGTPAGRPECGEGWFVEPTVFTGVRPEMRIAQEEVFGPVLAVIPFDDEDEAVEIANSTNFGLAAGVWTASMRRALTMSERLQAGTVWVNTYRAISHQSPFGGYKRSGIGRENGIDAIHEYVQTKSVWIDTREEVANPFVMR